MTKGNTSLDGLTVSLKRGVKEDSRRVSFLLTRQGIVCSSNVLKQIQFVGSQQERISKRKEVIYMANGLQTALFTLEPFEPKAVPEALAVRACACHAECACNGSLCACSCACVA